MRKSGRNREAATAGHPTTAMLDLQVGWEKMQVSKFDEAPLLDTRQ